MKRFFMVFSLLITVTGTTNAATPEQEMMIARMRLAGVCQSLLMDGLVETCTVDKLLGK